MGDKSNSFRTKLHGVTAEWQIADFLNLKSDNGEYISCPVFQESAEASWTIYLFPLGEDKDSIGYISLYLTLESASKYPLSATWTFSMKVNDTCVKTDSNTYTFGSPMGWGDPWFLNRSILIKLLELIPACTSVTIECTVRFLDKGEEIDDKLIPGKRLCQRLDECVKNLSSNLGDLLLNKEHSDVKINVGAKCYEVHKAVLSARSTVFASMFKHDMAENLSGSVDIPDCDPDNFGVFLEFLYTGKLNNVVYNNALNLYKIADKYCLKDLQRQCCIRLSQGLEIESICDVLELATTHEETDLLEKATEFFFENIKEIFASEKWLKFLNEKTSLANEFLKQMAERSKILPK